MTLRFKASLAAAILGMGLAALPGVSTAAEPESCKKVRFSDVGWTDITATTAVASVVLEALGYEPEIQVLSVPVTYQSLKNKDVDVFLGNWMPSMTADVKPFIDDGSVETVAQNLEGAGYGLVVPSYVAEAGVKNLKDIGPNKDKFGAKIYGIEPGNRESRKWPGGVRIGRIVRSRHAVAGGKGNEEHRVDRLPRVDAAPGDG
jgi:glycine betaine/proline transport system substrate-binding protein